MTKHLRFLIVLLLTLVWSAGWAQTTIWSEDWTGVKDTQTPSTFKPTIYTESSNVSIQTANPAAGGNAPELMIKSKSSWTVKITDLKGCKGDVTLTLKTNKIGRLSVSVGSSAINLTAVEGQTKTFSGTFNVDELVVPFNITFKNTATAKKDNLRLDDISLTGTSVEESKTDTKVSFGSNSGKTFTFTEGEYADGTFTAPTATEIKGVEGTIVYSSDNESAVKVNASTGALSFPGYGEATITATFTPNNTETYAVSTDSYKVKNERGVVAGTITFDKANGAFDLLNTSNDGYGTAKYDFVSDTNESYTFDCKGVMKTYANKGCLQIQKKTGKVASPAFPKFTNGYKVNIIYSSKKALQLSAGDANVVIGTTTSSNNTNGLGASVSISVPANVPFVITSGGSEVTYVSKIEIIPNKIDETETLTLNESATNTIEAKTGVNVTLNRPMNVGRWNTFCVPFSIDATQVTSQFGEGTQIAEYSVSKSKDEVIAFATVQSNAIVAGKAYLVKPTKEAATEGYTFSNVNITALKPTKETVDNGAIDFRGIYNPTDITEDLPTNTFAAGIVGNVVKKAVRGSNMKGFRAFFIIPEGVGAQSSYMLKIDGTVTSINSINGADVVVNAPVYNLQGQRVDGINLTPGIYVKAGKKFVVK